MSPPVIVGYLGVYDVRQMSELCKIPPHKIHQYYDIYAQLYTDPDIQDEVSKDKEHYSGFEGKET